MLVYVDPWLLVEIIITGITSVYPLDGLVVEIEVKVEVGPNSVVVLLIVIGYTQ